MFIVFAAMLIVAYFFILLLFPGTEAAQLE
jgi:hypothetical protein